MMMEFYGDYHCHSTYSDGRAEVQEIAEAAARRGLSEIAITDHGPGALGIGVEDAEIYQQVRCEAREANLAFDDVRVLVGAEANITSLDGDLDLPFEVARELDVLIAGMHPYTVPEIWQDGVSLFALNHLRHLGKRWRERAINANTKATVECLHRNNIDILAHPGLFFAVDTEEVARACVKNNVLFEINCGHEHPRVSAIIIAERVGVDFIISSDAHFTDTVGNFDYGEEIITRLGIDLERVANLLGGGSSVARSIGKHQSSYNYRSLRSREDPGS